MNVKNRFRIIQALFLLMMLVPNAAYAQWGFDIPSVEALISDHKLLRSKLAARAGVEQANELLHQSYDVAVCNVWTDPG